MSRHQVVYGDGIHRKQAASIWYDVIIYAKEKEIEIETNLKRYCGKKRLQQIFTAINYGYHCALRQIGRFTVLSGDKNFRLAMRLLSGCIELLFKHTFWTYLNIMS